jgi:hypothetical protein
MPVITAVKRLREEDCKFEKSLVYIVRQKERTEGGKKGRKEGMQLGRK